MQTDPSQDDLLRFIGVSRWMRSAKFHAPEVLAAAPELGLLLLEDLGDEPLTRLAGPRQSQAYGIAAAELGRLAGIEAPMDHGLPQRSPERLADELDVFLQWDGSAGSLLPGDRAAFLSLWREVLADARGPQGFVHADVHGDNLMCLGGRHGIALGWLDFQDAGIGDVAYDLVSLIEDTRADLSPEVRTHLVERYLAAFADAGTPLDPERLAAAIAIFGVQRNLRIIGVLERLSARGFGGFAAGTPRAWNHVRRALHHPALAEVRRWFAASPWRAILL